MDIERIRTFRLAKPFRPFALVLVDGRRLPVDSQFRLGISPTGTEIGYAASDGPCFISVRDVTDIEEGVATGTEGVSA